MNNFRNKIVYDAKDGSVKSDKKYMSMLEDFWMPRRGGSKSTEIVPLPGAGNVTGYFDGLEWFKNKMYEALNIPKGRLQSESGFNIGKSVEISRDEVKFQKFIDKLRNKFGQLLIDTLKMQLVLKGICSEEEWDEIKYEIKLDFQKDNYFSELKNQELLQSRYAMVLQLDDYLQKYVSKEWIQQNVLMMDVDEIKSVNKQIKKEAGDPSAQPNWKIQMQSQIDMQPEPPMPPDGQNDGQDAQGAQGAQGAPAPAPQGNPVAATAPEYDSSNYKN